MLIFYFNTISDRSALDTSCAYQSNDEVVKQCRNEEHCFSFFKDVIVNVLPELKILNQHSSIK
jgi:hypothetical protein